MVIQPETGTETIIPSESILSKQSMAYRINWHDLRFHLVAVSRWEIKKQIRGRTSKVRLYPSLTSFLSSILRRLDQKGIELICHVKRSDSLWSSFSR